MTNFENQNRSFFFMFYPKVNLLLNVPIKKELDWYAGFGGGLGSWNTDDNYNNGYAGDNGIFAVINGDIGIEYNFKEIPIQIAMDLRPEFVFNNYEKNDFGFNVGLAFRYKF